MDTVAPNTTMPDKAITVDVPADRVPEFYAWYARFLAGEPRRGRRRGRSGHRPHGHGHGGPGCRHDHHGEGEPHRGEATASSPTTPPRPTPADA